MPRHIRSVTARRPRRIAKATKPARRTATPATSAPEVELFDGLREAFQADPETTEQPERTRERYVLAIESLADYLEDIGADAAWVQRFEELGWALEDLTKGLVPPLLQPTRSKRPPPSAPGTLVPD
jgi:hypothetical protein